MRPTSPELDALLRHLTGVECLDQTLQPKQSAKFVGSRRPPRVAVETWPSAKREPSARSFDGKGQMPPPVRPHRWPPGGDIKRFARRLQREFGKKEFYAAISFFDMTGFSELAQGKAPIDVAALVAPFLGAVIEAATSNFGFVDKTMGDEVLVVMPLFPGLADPLLNIGWFLADVVRLVERDAPSIEFSAGIAFGHVVLKEIQTASYREWTVYGNCVNGAKRLQKLPSAAFRDQTAPSKYRAVTGAIESEQPEFRRSLEDWMASSPGELPLAFLTPRIDSDELRGVGRMCFLDTYLNSRPSLP